MKTRRIALIIATAALGILLTACTDLTDVNETHNKAVTQLPSGPIGRIRPFPTDMVTFNFDESAPAASTLNAYPTVASWRIIMKSSTPYSAVASGNMHKLQNTVSVMGFNARGKQIADGTVYVADSNKLDTWFCTVQVDGVALDMTQASDLIDNIVADISAGGDGNPFDKGCWWKATLAAASVGASIGEGAAVLAICFGTGGLGCAVAIAAYIVAEDGNAERIIDWYCSCIDSSASFCD